MVKDYKIMTSEETTREAGAIRKFGVTAEEANRLSIVLGRTFNKFYQVAREKYKSDRQLSIALGIAPSNFQKYKNGERSPTVETLQSWCDLTGIKWSSKFK